MGETVLFDYSQGRPTADQVRAAGGVAVLRYLPFDGSNRKDLTPEEVAELLDGGIGIGPIWETSSARALSGYSGGLRDSMLAVHACDDLGLQGAAVWFAVDFDVTNAIEFATVSDYFRGLQLHFDVAHIKCYGEYDVCKMLMDAELASGFWQTTAWSAGKWSPEFHMIQRIGIQSIGGTDADVNHWNIDAYPDMPGIYFRGDDVSADQVWAKEMTSPDGSRWTAEQLLIWSNHFDNQNAMAVGVLTTKLEGLAAAFVEFLAAYADRRDLDAAAIKSAVLDAMREGTVRVTVAIEERQTAFLEAAKALRGGPAETTTPERN